MKGIYLTEEGKKVIEDKIAELQEHLSTKQNDFTNHKHLCGFLDGQIDLLKEILSSATILSVEEDWDGVFNKTFSQAYIEKDYPNGVIIKPKK